MIIEYCFVGCSQEILSLPLEGARERYHSQVHNVQCLTQWKPCPTSIALEGLRVKRFGNKQGMKQRKLQPFKLCKLSHETSRLVRYEYLTHARTIVRAGTPPYTERATRRAISARLIPDLRCNWTVGSSWDAKDLNLETGNHIVNWSSGHPRIRS